MLSNSSPEIMAVWTPGLVEIIVIAIAALSISGWRLPGIARNAGKALVEFKKGLKEAGDFKNDITWSKDKKYL